MNAPKTSASPKMGRGTGLRERAAALTARASQVLRPAAAPEDPDPARRALVVGSLAGAAALPLPTLAAPEPPLGPHPDQALLDAEEAYRAAKAAYRTACDAACEAITAFHKARGRPPVELIMTRWEQRTFASLPYCRGVGYVRTYLVHRPQGPNGEWYSPHHAWTGHGLRRVIERAIIVLGQGGQTPHRIRRWKALLPIAAAFDARHQELSQRYRLAEFDKARDDAHRAESAACDRLDGLTATTAEGLAVKVRYAGLTSWDRMPKCWTTLLESAAAVSGVALAPRRTEIEG